MNCIRAVARPWIRRFVVLGVLGVLPVTRAHAQAPTNGTVARTFVEFASPITPEATETIAGQPEGAVTGRLAATSRVSSRVALTSEVLGELARPTWVRPSRLLSRAGQGGSPGSKPRGWVGRHPVLFGALVGVAPGVVFGEFELGRRGDMPHGPDMLVGAGIGAGLGSLVGLVVGLAR